MDAMSNVVNHLRHALRQLRRSLGFAVIAITTMALAIGAAAAMFTLLYTVLLRPLDVPNPSQVFAVFAHFHPQDVEHGTMSLADFIDWRNENHFFSEVAILSNAKRRVELESGGKLAEEVSGVATVPALFSILGVRPLLGRTLLPGEDGPSSASVAVISERLWHSRFNSSPQVLGQQVLLNGEQSTVVGVLPKSFAFWPNTDVWSNLRLIAPSRRGPFPYVGVARLAPGRSAAGAQMELNTLARQVETKYPTSYAHLSFPVVPLKDALVGRSRLGLLVLFGAVIAVLVIASTNIASLVLSRALGREQELSLRMALGASRAQLMQQLLVEGGVLSGLGAMGGLGFTWLILTVLRRFHPGNIPRIEDVHVDWPVLGFTVLVAVLIGVLFGLLPMLVLDKRNMQTSLRSGGRGNTQAGGGRTARVLLVISQICLSVLLLTNAGLLTRTVFALQKVDTGVRVAPSRVLVLQLSVNGKHYKSDAEGNVFYQKVLGVVTGIRGVSAASIGDSVPPSDRADWDTFRIQGRPWDQNGYPAVTDPVVSAGYFKQLGIPLLSGRMFTETDRPETEPVCLINDSLAKHYFGRRNPVGFALAEGGPDVHSPYMRIVGVVGNARYTGLRTAEEDIYYMAASQNFQQRTHVLVTSDLPAQELVRAVQSALTGVDDSAVVSRPETIEQKIESSATDEIFEAMLVGSFALVALILSALGIYGTVSYIVTQRQREVGVRMALGANRRDIFVLLMSMGGRLVGAGLILGLVFALASGFALSHLLFGVRATDPLIYVLVVGTVLCIGVIATGIPARRAARLDPSTALRDEF